MDLEALGATEEYELSAFDVVSLYPWVLPFMKCKIILQNFRQISTPNTPLVCYGTF